VSVCVCVIERGVVVGVWRGWWKYVDALALHLEVLLRCFCFYVLICVCAWVAVCMVGRSGLRNSRFSLALCQIESETSVCLCVCACVCA